MLYIDILHCHDVRTEEEEYLIRLTDGNSQEEQILFIELGREIPPKTEEKIMEVIFEKAEQLTGLKSVLQTVPESNERIKVMIGNKGCTWQRMQRVWHKFGYI